MKYKTLIAAIIFLFFPIFIAYAGSPISVLQEVGETGGYAEVDEYSTSKFIGTIITSLLSLLGVVFVVLMLYGGFKWMKASGREDEVGKAQDIIRNAIIGLILTASSYSISLFVMSRLLF